MSVTTDDTRIRGYRELSPPAHVLREYPLDDATTQVVAGARQAIHRILHGMDDRLLVVIGPCSIHDPRLRSTMRAVWSSNATAWQAILRS